MTNDIKKAIEKEGRLTLELKEKYFKGVDPLRIRDIFEEMGMDRHTPLELISTEIAVVTPFGILMQIRPYDNDQLGMWGGAAQDGEDPEDAAVRELKEETGIEIQKSQLKSYGIHDHFHQYANGDKVLYKSYRYAVKFDYVPKITTDEESVGAVMVVHTILDHQQDFIKFLLGEK